MAELTRIHIVSPDGQQEFFAKGWNAHVLDSGATLKLVATGDAEQAEKARRRRGSSLAEDLAVVARVAERDRQRRSRPQA